MKRLPGLGIALVCVAGAFASAKCSQEPRGAASISCFDAAVGDNSLSTQAVFAARHCQGGGVTWGAIVRALAERHGSLKPAMGPNPGMGGDVVTLNGNRLSIDEEGDVARVCADDPTLLGALKADYDRVNADPVELRATMATIDPLALECLDAGGRTPSLPSQLPPPLPSPAEAAAIRTGIDRLRAALDHEPAWCFPDNDSERRRGVLRLLPDGSATQSDRDGLLLTTGRWTWPRSGSGDDRIEIVLKPAAPGTSGVASLLHLDVGDSGHLGWNLIGAETIEREEMIPGSTCLRAP